MARRGPRRLLADYFGAKRGPTYSTHFIHTTLTRHYVIAPSGPPRGALRRELQRVTSLLLLLSLAMILELVKVLLANVTGRKANHKML